MVASFMDALYTMWDLTERTKNVTIRTMPFPISASPSSDYQKLHALFSDRHRTIKERLLTKHKDSVEWIMKNIPAKEHIAAGSLSGLLLFAPPVIGTSVGPSADSQSVGAPMIKDETFLITDLAKLLPDEVGPLTPDQEATISGVLSREYGFDVKPEIDGIRLNRSYGYIGAEQHLMRYPGDTMASHFSTADEAFVYGKSGMAPGRGAWGYFTTSKYEMTQKDIDREKYYLAVQTFLAPGFHDNVKKYVDFFKYRKMLVINPQNGKAMVVVIGDAGPAQWTGKQLGGSPEVMKYLERVDGRAKGAVLYFFIDDPDDKIPLGPVEL